MEEEPAGLSLCTDRLFDAIPFGLLLADRKLTARQANPHCTRLLALEHRLWRGRPLEALLPVAGLAERGRRVLDGHAAGDALTVNLIGTSLHIALGRLDCQGNPLLILALAECGEALASAPATEAGLQASEERFRLLMDNAVDYAIFMLDPEGRVINWNEGAQRILGYGEAEVLGRRLDRIFTPEDRRSGVPAQEMESARAAGRASDNRWLLRKDGSRFWASGTLTALRDERGRLRGYAKILRDRTEQKLAEEQLLRLNAQLEQRLAEIGTLNHELEAFSYSVSHDLRAPLRAIDGFSQILQEDYAERLDDAGQDYLNRVRGAAQRMGQLIDDLLRLAQVPRGELQRESIDLSQLAQRIAAGLAASQPVRRVEFVIAPAVMACADLRLLQIAMENLLGNAWKFTGKQADARIEFGAFAQDGQTVYFVRDNGAGFDMSYAHKLFGAFQRLHGAEEFAGTGIGLATVARIIARHGGRIWAEGAVGQGATFYFTLGGMGS
ncbi:MAG: sensor histidine kinase [Pseudomonadota bacterium]